MTTQMTNHEENQCYQTELRSNNADIAASETPGTNQLTTILFVFDDSEKYISSICQNTTENTVTNKTQNDLQKSVDIEIIEPVGDHTTTSNVELIEISSSSESESNKNDEERSNETTNTEVPYTNLTHYCSTCDRLFVKPKDRAQKYCEKCKTKLQYECMICHRRYWNKVQVFGHVKTKFDCRKRSDFHCNDCDYRSIHKGYLKHHIFTKHMSIENLVPCSKCGRHFKRKFNAREHELSCGRTPYLKCRFCDFQTTYRISFQVHMKIHIIDPKKGAALINEKFKEVVVDPDILLASILNEGDTLKTIQNKTNNRNKNKKTAKPQHYIDLYYRGLIKMYCYKCKETTSVREKKFNNCQKCSTELIYGCGLCSSKFNTCPNTIRHLRNRHGNCNLMSIYVCGICDKLFNDYKQFQRHDTKCRRKLISCSVCPYKAKTKRILKNHNNKWHVGPLKDLHRPCCVCGRHIANEFCDPEDRWCSNCR